MEVAVCVCGGGGGLLLACSVTLVIEPVGFVHSSFGTELEKKIQFKPPPQG